MICCLKWYARCCFVVAIPEKNAVLVFFWVVKDCLHRDFEIQQFCHQVLWNTCSAAIRINPIPFRSCQNIFCNLVHSLLGDSCVAVVEQQTRIDKMKLCWFHARRYWGVPTRRWRTVLQPQRRPPAERWPRAAYGPRPGYVAPLPTGRAVLVSTSRQRSYAVTQALLPLAVWPHPSRLRIV